MNQMKAMQDTVKLMEDSLQRIAEDGDAAGTEIMRIEGLDPSLQPQHIRAMLAAMESGVNPQDTEREFGEAKMGRWLGWAQAAMVAMGLADLDDMKALNKLYAGAAE